MRHALHECSRLCSARGPGDSSGPRGTSARRPGHVVRHRVPKSWRARSLAPVRRPSGSTSSSATRGSAGLVHVVGSAKSRAHLGDSGPLTSNGRSPVAVRAVGVSGYRWGSATKIRCRRLSGSEAVGAAAKHHLGPPEEEEAVLAQRVVQARDDERLGLRIEVHQGVAAGREVDPGDRGIPGQVEAAEDHRPAQGRDDHPAAPVAVGLEGASRERPRARRQRPSRGRRPPAPRVSASRSMSVA